MLKFTAITLSLALSSGLAAAKPRTRATDPAVAAATAQLKGARAKAKIAKAVKSARNAQRRADTAIERCEQAIVDACVLAATPTSATCEDDALRGQFAACHAKPAPIVGRTAKLHAKHPKAKEAQLAAYEDCMDDMETDDEDAAAERCAGELE